MLTNSNIILIFLIGVIILFFIYGDNKSSVGAEKFIGTEHRKKRKMAFLDDNVPVDLDDITNDGFSLDSSVLAPLFPEEIHPNFVSNQFHNDYRDVLTAINNLLPDKKQK